VRSNVFSVMFVIAALATILLVNGCASSMPPKPPRPVLESLTPTIDGGICLDRMDAMELLLYIYALEDGYDL